MSPERSEGVQLLSPERSEGVHYSAPERSEGAQQSSVWAKTRIASASEHSAVCSRGLLARGEKTRSARTERTSIPQTWIVWWDTPTAPRKRVGQRHTRSAACLIVRGHQVRGTQAARASARAYTKRSGRVAARKIGDAAFASIRVGFVRGDGCKTGAQRHERA